MASVISSRDRSHVICSCGSGYRSAWQYDARNIPLARTCVKCHKKVMARYRPEVLTDPNYQADEPIEES